MPPATFPAVAHIVQMIGSNPSGPTHAIRTASELKGITLPSTNEPINSPRYPQSIKNWRICFIIDLEIDFFGLEKSIRRAGYCHGLAL